MAHFYAIQVLTFGEPFALIPFYRKQPKEYRLKIYNKTEEQYGRGNLTVEKNLLRIEVVFIDRSLRRMYGERRSVMDMLSIQSMETMCRAYKKVLEEDLINRAIKPCLNYCVARLLESLISSTPGREISETVISHKVLIHSNSFRCCPYKLR